MEGKERTSFGGTVGFILAAAGSAVGLGNIWRFPYLAAKGGGGLFLLIYLILALTFGFTLLTTELAIGRKTRQSPLTAYRQVHKSWGFLGPIAGIIPFIILPYYCVIGGWVLKYMVGFFTGAGEAMAQDGYFASFIQEQWEPIFFLVIFLFMVSFVVIRGVNKGIEASSKIMMPILLVLVILIAFFALTIQYQDGTVTRTGLQGLKVYVVPDFKNLTLSRLLVTVMDAMGQLFYSISVAMGIMVAYGSYVKDNANLVQSIKRIEFFDTLVAFLAGAMIIPAVFAFQGNEGMSASGPGLMFVSLPKVFQAMGAIGTLVGALFFVMVLFAALTSAVSILEAVTSSLMDQFGMERKPAALLESAIALVLGVVVCLGYNKFYFEIPLPNGATAQILDIMDYVSNQVLMPLLAVGTCILVGWVVKPQYAIDEMTKNGERFSRKTLYTIMVKYITPAMLMLLFFRAIGIGL